MNDLSSDVVRHLSLANVLTVGELSQMNGEQILSVLDQRYDLVGNLIVAYIKNNIPFDLLGDLPEMADNYRRKKLHEIECELKKQEIILDDIENGLKELKSKFKDSHLLE